MWAGPEMIMFIIQDTFTDLPKKSSSGLAEALDLVLWKEVMGYSLCWCITVILWTVHPTYVVPIHCENRDVNIALPWKEAFENEMDVLKWM